MQIQYGFVTNSSSSSFIIAWPREIKTIDDVKEFITDRFAKTIFKDAISQSAMRISDPKVLPFISEEMSHGATFVDDVPDIWVWDESYAKREGITMDQLHSNIGWLHQCWDEREKKVTEACRTQAQKFLGELTDEHYIYMFHYSDNDGEYFSDLEHGNVFEKLEGFQISKH